MGLPLWQARSCVYHRCCAKVHADGIKVLDRARWQHRVESTTATSKEERICADRLRSAGGTGGAETFTLSAL